ncbi:HNH endonuclease [bacterium]|nr:HNH endonuclease [bacterium]
MERFDIEKDKIVFKNLLSGPAPVGRILNYVLEAGGEGIYHINGYRELSFTDRVGSAWTTEFMIGLGIFYLGPTVGSRTLLCLTEKGEELLTAIKESRLKDFNEGIDESSIDSVRDLIMSNGSSVYQIYERIFITSYPFKILVEFLNQNGYVYPNKKDFMDDLFETVKNLYDVAGSAPYNRAARTTTGENRVPSLLQLCKLFNLVEEKNGQFTFFKKNIEKEISKYSFKEYTQEQVEEEAKQLELLVKSADELAKKYGIDGTVMTESIVRNSELQKMFKYNLVVSQNSKCAMCDISNPQLLNGSHIKPASESNVHEKADFNNGLLLCCNHDRLFDRNLITFNMIDGQIEISKTLSEHDINSLGLKKTFKLSEELLSAERKEYLAYHNMEFQNKEKDR